MDKDFWKSQVYNALELANFSRSNRAIKALKSMIRKYEKTFNEKLDIKIPEAQKYDKKYLSFKEFYSEANNSNHDS